MSPKPPAHQSEQVVKGGVRLWIPSGLRPRDLSIGMKGISHEHHDAEQTKAGWGCALNGVVTPLPLGFNAQVSPCLFKGDFMGPAFDIIGDDGGSGLMDIGGKVSNGGALALGIPDQNPADAQRRCAG